MLKLLVDASELISLYKYFTFLDKLSVGKLTNNQVFELPWIKVCPFKERLVYAFKMKSDNDVERGLVIQVNKTSLDNGINMSFSSQNQENEAYSSTEQKFLNRKNNVVGLESVMSVQFENSPDLTNCSLPSSDSSKLVERQQVN